MCQSHIHDHDSDNVKYSCSGSLLYTRLVNAIICKESTFLIFSLRTIITPTKHTLNISALKSSKYFHAAKCNVVHNPIILYYIRSSLDHTFISRLRCLYTKPFTAILLR